MSRVIAAPECLMERGWRMQGQSQESNIGDSTKKYSFMCTWEERRTKGECLAAGRGQEAASGGDAASDVSMSYLRFLLVLCCCRAVCDAARAESVRCVLDEKPNSRGDEEAHCGRNKITEYSWSSPMLPPNWAAGFLLSWAPNVTWNLGLELRGARAYNCANRSMY